MKHLTEVQRYAISVMWQKGFSKAKIASAIGVHKSTISRDLQRNKDEKSGIYDWAKAQRKSKERQQARVRFHRLTDEMHEAIVTKLSMDWSPEQISGDCRVRGIDCVSHETIYRMIWKDKEEGGTMYTHLRRKGRRKAKRELKNQYRGLIPNRLDIDDRPPVVDEKTRLGDQEGDTIIGKNHKGANENTNGLYRQYIPKGTDFQTLDKDVLPTARLMLNTRPRKRLNFISPIQEIYRIFASDFKLINIVNKVAFVT